MSAVTSATAISLAIVGCSRARSRASKPSSDHSIMRAYMRADVAYKTANGDVAISTTVAAAQARPPSRLPAAHANGSDTTDVNEEKARTATLPLPKTAIQ